MLRIKNVLEKLAIHSSSQDAFLSSLMSLSFSEIRKQTEGKITWSESRYLHKIAQENKNKNRTTNSKILSRANPQLQNAIHLGINKSPLTEQYNELLDGRADSYVKEGSVASMFSPAGYLTELYREARSIDLTDSVYHLDTRRPDLKELALTQNNLDSEISTLSLSNEILLQKINKSNEDIMDTLSTYRWTIDTPYNEPYEAVRQAMLLQDRSLTALNQAPDIISLSNSASLSALKSDISPELYSILIEDIKIDTKETEIEALWKENFGEVSADRFKNVESIAQYYDVSNDELEQLMRISDAKNKYQSQYINNQKIAIIKKDDKLSCVLVESRSAYDLGINTKYFEMIPVTGTKNNFNLNLNITSMDEGIDSSAFFVRLTPPKPKVGRNLINAGAFPKEIIFNTHYSLPCNIAEEDFLLGEVDIHLSDKTHNSGAIFKFTKIPFKNYLLCLNKIIRLYKASQTPPEIISYIIERNGGIFNINDATLSMLFYIQSSMTNYNLDIEQALALTHTGISLYALDGELSLFDRLFNSPSLGGKIFRVTDASLDLTPGVEGDTFNQNVIKRGLQVNENELAILWRLATGKLPTEFTLSLDNLSSLYTIQLLARIHNLSIAEISMLLSVSPYADVPLKELITSDDLGKIVYFISNTVSWLREKKWSVSDLFIMTTKKFSNALSTDIENLLSTLRNGLDIDQIITTNLTAILTFQLNGWGDGDLAEVSLICIDAKGAEIDRNKVSVAPEKQKWIKQQVTLVLPPDSAFLEIEVKAINSNGQVTDVHFDDFQLSFSQPLAIQMNNPSAEMGDLSGWTLKNGDFRVISEQDGIKPFAGNYYFSATKKRVNEKQEDVISQKLDIASASMLFTKTAPFIAAAVQLDSNEKAISVLRWLDMLKPADLSVSQFFALVLKDSPSSEEMEKVIIFCQALGQLALVIRATRISGWMINLLTGNPKILDAKNDILPNNLSTLQMITRLDEFIHSCDKMANSVLGEMAELNITTQTLSQAMQVNEGDIEQILSITQTKNIVDFFTVNIIQQWLDVSSTLKISPNDINALIDLNYMKSRDEEAPASYAAWVKISEAMQSGLSSYQSTQLTQYLEERKSAALSSYLIREKFFPAECITRDDLYNYLLIDNRISGTITTTRIAEAIASIQLYINLTLNNSAGAISDDIRTRQFFVDWDLYNKRYSTWAGVSILSYYPENYIDPTVRIGQTRMMDTLLQSVNQNGVNKDTVEDAFKTYLTSFEQIANLEVISGYHNAPNTNTGLTYFIGRNNSEQATYYWRSVDHSKMQNGIFAANAWTEWSSIENGMLPYNNYIRPVIFNSRLYVVWIEKITKAEESESSIVGKDSYVLKLSHIRYDGTWSTPTSFELSDKIAGLSSDNVFTDFYCTVNTQDESMYVILYNKKMNYTEKDIEQCEILAITVELDILSIVDTAKSDIFSNCYKLFDSEKNRLVNSIYVKGEYHVGPSESGAGKNKSDISLSRSSISSAKLGVVNNGNLPIDVDLVFCCDIQDSPAYVTSDIYNLFVDIITNDDTFFYASFPMYLVDDNANPTTISDYLFLIGFNKETLTLTGVIYDKKNKTQPENENGGFGINLYDEGWILGFTGHSVKVSSRQSDLLLSNNIKKCSLLYGYTTIDNIFVSANNWLEMLPLLKVKFENLRLSPVELVNGSEMSITLEASDGSKKEFNTATWYGNKVTVTNGDNSFPSKSGVLALNIPTEAFISTNAIKLDITLAINTKSNSLISSYHFAFDIAKVDEFSLISLKSNAKGAQYLSIQHKEGGGADLVRLNTLFARQLVARANTGIDTILSLSTQNLPEPKLEGDGTDPMDFSGANALYFWELFFYTPMMVVNTLLQDNNFTEAQRWLKYVFSPDGFIDQGVYDSRKWNVRPLLEDTSWNEAPLNSNDPDAVAQNDPMHYKVFTFMKLVDLILMQGDLAYRRLERDTLNEAKMWYMQALSLLGDEEQASSYVEWNNPTLGVAADTTVEDYYQKCLLMLSNGAGIADPVNANSLSALFLPQINEKLDSYWKTLTQRLYNLRHNLSIDGQPLSLPIYAPPADPKALLNASVSSSLNNGSDSIVTVPLNRFSTLLDDAKGMVNQLIQFGNTLLSMCERQDSEGLSQLLQTQGSELVLQNIAIQGNTIQELEAEKETLIASRKAAQIRAEHYEKLYDENVSSNESQVMDLYNKSSTSTDVAIGLYVGAAIADIVPNIYGLAIGGARYGGAFSAAALGAEIAGSVMRTEADKISQSEIYRRRRDEWMLSRDTATAEIEQIDSQLHALDIRQKAADMQKAFLETQQLHAQAQLAFMQTKFTSQSLYSWLRGRLMAIYSPFYDLCVSRGLMVEQAWSYELNEVRSFIKPGAWQGTYSGLLAGENLMLMLGQMEAAYLEKDKRALEVTRTVSLASVYAGLGKDKAFAFSDVADLVNKGADGAVGDSNNGVNLSTDTKALNFTIKLSELNIDKDYPAELGNARRIRQIGITLPTLLAPYQDIRAILSYSGNEIPASQGREHVAISHGMDDSGQFLLDFNDKRYLPFEGLPVNGQGVFGLQFPDAINGQKSLLLNLNDIILHIRYTIR